MTALVGGVVALSVAATASPIVLRLMRGRVMDVPNARSSHSTPTPRGGGLAIVLGVAAGVLVTGAIGESLITIFALALVYAVIGFIDDLRDLPVVLRLGLQILAGVIGLMWIVTSWVSPAWLAVVLAITAVVWIVGFTNAFNFMDGINGISAAQLTVAGGYWAAVGGAEDLGKIAALGTVTAGAALGFLPWNFPRAVFFMGDVGSYFSGSLLAAGTIVGIQLGIPALPMAAPLFVYGADTGITLIRRIARGERWYEAHQDHVYQQLVVEGWSHAKTTGFYSIVAGLVAVSGLLWLHRSTMFSAVGTTLAAAALIGYLISPHIVSRTGNSKVQ